MSEIDTEKSNPLGRLKRYANVTFSFVVAILNPLAEDPFLE